MSREHFWWIMIRCRVLCMLTYRLVLCLWIQRRSCYLHWEIVTRQHLPAVRRCMLLLSEYVFDISQLSSTNAPWYCVRSRLSVCVGLSVCLGRLKASTWKLQFCRYIFTIRISMSSMSRSQEHKSRTNVTKNIHGSAFKWKNRAVELTR